MPAMPVDQEDVDVLISYPPLEQLIADVAAVARLWLLSLPSGFVR